MLKYIASIPVVLSLLAATYGGINYVNKLNNTIDDNEDAIALLQVEIDNVYNGFGDEIDNIHQIYSDRTKRNFRYRYERIIKAKRRKKKINSLERTC